MRSGVFSVTNVNRYVKELIESDVLLGGFFMEGEISNFKNHSSGHFYFTLKDDNSAISAVMFRGAAQELLFLPENGMKVITYGRISIYEKTGQFQFYAESMEPSGKGGLYAAFEQLKAKLLKEGLFDEAHKKPIPVNPTHVCIITSPTGAAVRDIINVAKRRNSGIRLTLLPVQVQGISAAQEIAEAILTAGKKVRPDVIILGRGGGSMEDLWAFNEEIVARAIYNSKIPIISAVGHETDFTIADFVADLRAATPSAAAELAVADLFEMSQRLKNALQRLNFCMNARLQFYNDKLVYLDSALSQKRLLENIVAAKKNLRYVTSNMSAAMEKLLKMHGNNLSLRVSELDKLSPFGVFKRGYGLLSKQSGERIYSVCDVSPGDNFSVKMKDGRIDAEVVSLQKEVGE